MPLADSGVPARSESASTHEDMMAVSYRADVVVELVFEVEFAIGVARFVVCRRAMKKSVDLEGADMSWMEGMVNAVIVVDAATSNVDAMHASLIVPCV